MILVQEILKNQVLTCAAISWFVAQLIKVFLTLLIEGTLKLERLHGSGGMPSAHTATIVSASTAIGLLEGFASPVYGFSLIMAFIVMYDASGVRRSVGKQAKLLNNMIQDLQNHKFLGEERLKELIGHKPTEVAAGAILGVIMANILI